MSSSDSEIDINGLGQDYLEISICLENLSSKNEGDTELYPDPPSPPQHERRQTYGQQKLLKEYEMAALASVNTRRRQFTLNN